MFGSFKQRITEFKFSGAEMQVILVSNIFFYIMTIKNIQKAADGTEILNKKNQQQL